MQTKKQDIKLSPLITFSDSIRKPFTKERPLNNDNKDNKKVANDALSHFTADQKQSIIKIFDECYENLERLSK